MKKFLTKENLRKLEAWSVTLIFGFFILSMLINSRSDIYHTPVHFSDHHIKYSFFENYFMPMLFQGILFYSALMVLILVVEPKWEEERSFWKTGGSIAFISFSTALLKAVSDTYLDAWRFGTFGSMQVTYNHIFFDAFAMTGVFTLVYIAYYLVKNIIGKVISNAGWSFPSGSALWTKILAGGAIWLIAFVFLAASRAEEEIIALWAFIVPYSVAIIVLNVTWLIPGAEVKKFFHQSYLLKLTLIVVALDFMATLLFALATNIHGPEMVITFMLILMWTALALLPWSWYLYKGRQDKAHLETALGTSDASLSFLKSQINPHFLFNALNTLYGTALQEKADRTGVGIQKLGDMMRFMLQENTQDKISLTRDIDYLDNYIDLQKLRTSRSADITIETQIEEQLNNLEISPMLLIPFVENAFKHGISLQQPSHIRVTLQSKGNTLYFDVHNSIHIKADNDPEKLKSGIGLQNVKQRLALLYPGRHELIIRESAKEFFVHLTLELK